MPVFTHLYHLELHEAVPNRKAPHRIEICICVQD